jgi:phage tail P2-like protein
MSDLLPPNATELERAIATALGEIQNVPVAIRDIWNPDTCPAEILPWLAWAFSVEDWNESWTDQQKRETIRSAISVQQHKGTIGAVREALASLGIDLRIQEWFNQSPAGDPYTFRVWLESEQTPVTNVGIDQVLTIVERLKSLRSHLDRVLVRTTTRSRARVATATNLGAQITVNQFDARPIVTNELAFVVG